MFTNFKLNMLNKKAASPESKPKEILEKLDIHKGDIIGDIGAGGGYFTLEFSKLAGSEGKIYVIDTNQKALDFIEKKSTEEGINNIKTVLAIGNGLSLPEKVDLLFMRNVLHHLPEPVAYFKHVKQFLKNKGQIALIDYKEKTGFIGLTGHYVPEDVQIDVMEKAGFSVDRKFDFLSEQSYLIFKIR